MQHEVLGGQPGLSHRVSAFVRLSEVSPDERRRICTVGVAPVVALEAGILVEMIAPVEAAIRAAPILKVDELQVVCFHVTICAFLRAPGHDLRASDFT